MNFTGDANCQWLDLIERIAGIGVWEIDLESSTMAWSDGVYNMLGMEPSSGVFELELLADLVHPDDLEKAQQQFDQTVNSGATYNIQKRIKHAEGYYIYVRSKAELTYKNGVPAYLTGVFFDVTNYERTKSQLNESQRQAQFLLENADGIFWEADPESFDFLYISPQIKDVLGYSRDEWLMSHEFWLSKIHPEDRERVKQEYQQHIVKGEDHKLEYRIIDKNGSCHWFQQRVKMICDEAQRPHRLTGMMVDISKECALQLELESEKELLEGLLDHLPSSFFLFDQEGNQLMWNKKLLELSEYSAEEIRSIKPPEMFEGQERKKAEQKIVETFQKGFAEVEVDLTTKSGGKIPFLFKAAATEYKGKNCIYGIGTDLRQLKQKDAIIRENERRFKALINEGGDVITTLDRELRQTYVSPSSSSVLHIKPGDLEGMKFTDYIHEQDKQRILTALNDARSKKRIKLEPYRFKNGKGNWCWLQTVITNAIDVDSVGGFVLNSRDITENQRNLKRLKKSEARYRGLFDSQTNYVVRTDLEGKFTFVNNKFLSEYDWLYPDGIIGGQAGKTAVDEHQERVVSTVAKCIKRPGSVYQVVLNKKTKRPGGQTTIWDFVCIKDEHNQPSEIQCVGIDITERSKFERQLKESNERFELIARTTNDAIWDYDFIKGSFALGHGFDTLFGYDIQSNMKDIFDLPAAICHPDDAVEINQQLKAKIDGKDLKDDWITEFRIIKNDGGHSYVRNRAHFIRNEKGEVVRALGAITDISQRKAFELQLKELNLELKQKVKALDRSNQELEQFAYVASHDLQEPLRMITNFLDLLEKKCGDGLGEKAKTYIHYATDGASRMRELILDLLDFSRAGRGHEKNETFDLSVLLDNVLAMHRKSIEEKNVQITMDTMPVIYSWKVPVQQVFQNLVSNALKFSDPKKLHPQITINYEELKDVHLFHVIDDGIGIHADYHEKVFVIFQRLANSKTTGGTGIGLALVKKIIDNLGGTIKITSEEDKGTTFSFTIPKLKAEPHKKGLK